MKDQSNGYPQTDINKAGVLIKGRWIAGTQNKVHAEMRGTGAAVRGKKYLTNPGTSNR